MPVARVENPLNRGQLSTGLKHWNRRRGAFTLRDVRPSEVGPVSLPARSGRDRTGHIRFAQNLAALVGLDDRVKRALVGPSGVVYAMVFGKAFRAPGWPSYRRSPPPPQGGEGLSSRRSRDTPVCCRCRLRLLPDGAAHVPPLDVVQGLFGAVELDAFLTQPLASRPFDPLLARESATSPAVAVVVIDALQWRVPRHGPRHFLTLAQQPLAQRTARLRLGDGVPHTART